MSSQQTKSLGIVFLFSVLYLLKDCQILIGYGSEKLVSIPKHNWFKIQMLSEVAFKFFSTIFFLFNIHQLSNETKIPRKLWMLLNVVNPTSFLYYFSKCLLDAKSNSCFFCLDRFVTLAKKILEKKLLYSCEYVYLFSPKLWMRKVRTR